jgi:Tol biopolymer transport system component/DNA-binding winged helix-turn-helix (wHTH) protein
MQSEVLPAIISPCEFGEFKFDPSDGQLCSPQSSVRLQPRLAKLLAILIAHSDLVLSREQLNDNLWPDKIVNDDALSRCVAELRAVLKDKSNTPTYIETVPKKGYRFIHPLESNKTGRMIISVMVLFSSALLLITLYSSHPGDFSNDLKTGLNSATRLTTDTELELHPELSNNGEMIAFTIRKKSRLVIRLINAQGEPLYDIEDPEQNLYSASFSHDDQSLFVGGFQDGQCKIYRYQLPSLIREEIVNCFMPTMAGIFDPSPDGEQLAYVAKSTKNDSTNAAIWVHHFKSKQNLQLTAPTLINDFDTRPRYSANGKLLAFTRGTESSRSIHVLDLNSENPSKPITSDLHYITSFDWLNNEHQIVFDSNHFGDRKLWLADTNNEQLQLLGAKDAQFPSFDKSNSVLVYREVRFNANIWSIDLTTEKAPPIKLIESIKYNNFPSFSPDGKKIAFVTNRSGRGEVWIYSQDTQQQTEFFKLPQHDLVMPSWSADGRKIMVSRRGPKGYRCIEIDMKSKQQKVIDVIVGEHFACVYTVNGDILAVSKSKVGNNGLLKLDPQGNILSLSDENITRVEVSPQGLIVFTLNGTDGIYSMDINGDNRQTLIKEFSPSLDGYWTLKGHYLYFPKVRESRGIWRRNLISGEEQLVTEVLPSTVGLSISVNSTHSQLVFSQTDSIHADIYMADLSQKQ